MRMDKLSASLQNALLKAKASARQDHNQIDTVHVFARAVEPKLSSVKEVLRRAGATSAKSVKPAQSFG